jgi:hypothetical protein
MVTVAGESIPHIERLDIINGADPRPGAAWILQGVTSNERYVERREKNELAAKQPATGRAEATQGALIPLRKNAEWWALTQDERRRILEVDSKHIQIGLQYLPAVARRLHHCRDLAENAPFDFITWFEFAPRDRAAFDELLARLRETKEWSYVDREIEIRVERD